MRHIGYTRTPPESFNAHTCPRVLLPPRLSPQNHELRASPENTRTNGGTESESNAAADEGFAKVFASTFDMGSTPGQGQLRGRRRTRGIWSN